MMGLVDYTSSSDSEPSISPPAKKVKRSSPSATPLPPLPETFHDLYASTVRQSTTDDPALHQGRRRQIPHVPGNWPSHLYIEWRPSSAQHSLLGSFLAELQSQLQDVEVTGFLTSDLGAPLPLHISLSRPFVLSTAEKDDFLEKLTDGLTRTRINPFTLSCGSVEWHRTPESSRSFLVLRVRSHSQDEEDGCELDGLDQKGTRSAENGKAGRNPNPELTVLLTRCNTAVAAYGQPQLYQWADDARIGDAFHVSIAWSFAEPDEELRKKTAEVFADPRSGDAIRQMEMQVDNVKVKIGNVVNHIPLTRGSKTRLRGLFGV